ncbi:MAG: hypothetical protein A2X79_01255 [Desulfuromonadaceae bacterium GWB2_53_15]|nr:MAG: hypothetical protein A2X83_11135 [Desulfuromonadales bacterium GWD2_54_10]OHB25804.1 MAG: hypothetical protein A2X79_01255 [Desulfuromonadaceae bacterium GWB2_53_15]
MANIVLSKDFEDLSDKVEVNPLVYQHWVDALSEFASSVRLRNGFSSVVEIAEENWHLNDDGDLVITATIEMESMQMIVPRGLWEWL